MRLLAEDEIVVKENEINRVLYRVKSGSVATFINYGKPNEYLVGVMGVGKCFGETGFLIGDPSPYTVVANEDTELEEIFQSDFQRFVIENPKSAIDIMTNMAVSVNLLERHVTLLDDEGEDAIEGRKELMRQLRDKIRRYRNFDFSN